jgi:virginiamycin B lyase
LVTVPAAAAPSPVAVFVPPAGTDGAFGVTAGPGGTYFAHGATIDRVAHGHITEFALPDPATADAGWLTWPGGDHIWFADRGTGRVGTMTASGEAHEYQLPPGADGHAVPQGLVVGPGPFLWATDYLNGRIDRLDTRSGDVLVYPIPTAESGPVGMVRGLDGALWFVERTTGKLARLSPGGRVVEWTLPAGAFPNRIIIGPDRRIWFTELGTNQLGRIGSNWRLSQSPLPGGAVGITRGPDGHVYVALNATGQLARLNGAGGIATTWDLPGSVNGALQVAPSRGRIWVTDPFDDLVFAVAVGH